MHPPKSLALLGGVGTTLLTAGGVVSLLSVDPALTIGFSGAMGVAVAALFWSVPRLASRGLWNDERGFELRAGAITGVVGPLLLAPAIFWLDLPVQERFVLAGYLLGTGLAGAGGAYAVILTRLRRADTDAN